jgi:hypothetical protein
MYFLVVVLIPTRCLNFRAVLDTQMDVASLKVTSRNTTALVTLACLIRSLYCAYNAFIVIEYNDPPVFRLTDTDTQQ